MEITLVLRPRIPFPTLHGKAKNAPARRGYLTQTELEGRHAARPDDIAAVRAFAGKHRMKIVQSDRLRRTVQISGAADAIEAAFGATPHQRAALPLQLQRAIVTVLGLEGEKAALRPRAPFGHRGKTLLPLRDLARAYDFPEGVDGRGQTIGLIELGGGFSMKDILRFSKENGLKPPRISTVEVEGGANRPASPRAIQEMLDCVCGKRKISAAAAGSARMQAAQATVEVTMDIEIVCALAPGARIVVYFGTPDEQGIYNTLSRAIHDKRHRPDALSISWGEAEIAVSDDYLQAIDGLLHTACHMGITVCASSGDAGSQNHSPDHLPAVNFPASSPHCLACGGTTSKFSVDRGGVVEVVEEVVWNATHFGWKGATGGGVSRKFGVPRWQRAVKIPLSPVGQAGRGVPDVAGPADPRYGFEIQVAGRSCASAGTSAVAPLWAALIACCNQALGKRCGQINAHLYKIGRRGLPALRPVVSGNNGAYKAGPGWDPCTGYGTPSGTRLLDYLRRSMRSADRYDSAGKRGRA